MVGQWLMTGRGGYDVVILGRLEDAFISKASVEEVTIPFILAQ